MFCAPLQLVLMCFKGYNDKMFNFLLIVLFIGGMALRGMRNRNFGDVTSGFLSTRDSRQKNRQRRKRALKSAKEFLKPYDDIFGKLCLSNNNCSVSYAPEESIFMLEKIPDENGGRRSFKIENFGLLNIDEIFDIICIIFDSNMAVRDILMRCGSGITIEEAYIPGKSKVINEKVEKENVPETSEIEINQPEPEENKKSGRILDF